MTSQRNMMPAPSEPTRGRPQHRDARVAHLALLLRNLPDSLPLDPSTSSLQFGLDEELLKEGLLPAVSHALEIAFGTWKNRNVDLITFSERGKRYDSLILLFKRAFKELPPCDCDVIQEAWLEQLIRSAAASGAKIPKKRCVTVSSFACHLLKVRTELFH
jgi:hypothetical protein